MKNSLTLHTHLCLLQLLSHSFSIKLGRSISTCQDLQDSSCQPNLWFARRGLQIPIQIDMWRPLLTNKNNTRANVVTNLINLIPLLVYQYLKNRFFYLSSVKFYHYCLIFPTFGLHLNPNIIPSSFYLQCSWSELFVCMNVNI